jgi:hypothetical protein
MPTMESQALTAIIAGSISLVVSGVVAARTLRKKLEADYDATLRTERLAEYRKLWQLTEPTGWYGRHEITSETAKRLLSDIDHWYFENGGGLLLSDISYECVEEVLRALDRYDGTVEDVRRAASKLREALTYDIGGRKRPLLRPRIRQQELERPDLITPRVSSL